MKKIKAWMKMTRGEIEFLFDFLMCMFFMGSATIIALNYDTLKLDVGLRLPIIVILECCLGFAISWTLLMNSNKGR